MNEASPDDGIRVLLAIADRLDALADSAELMGDPDGAGAFRERASTRRLEALALLDR